MTRANLGLLTGAVALSLAAASACASMDSEAAMGEGNGAGGNDARSPGLGAAESVPARGVVLVHAAQFPSFRLCFENMPDELPQPDSKIMPESNVVGVEIGSVVRLPPLKAPGKVFVLDERYVRSTAGAPDAVKCGDLVADAIGRKKSSKSLVKNSQYFEVSEITTSLGEHGVEALAITGCASRVLLDELGTTNAACGDGWSEAYGNLNAKVVPLGSSQRTADSTLPVQLFHMAPAIDAFKGSDGSLEVTFDRLRADDAGAPADAGTSDAERREISIGAPFEGGRQTTLDIDESRGEAVYGSYGFRIRITSSEPPFTVDQSLADIQALSAPAEVVTDYYHAASNYALLLLGDPTHRPEPDAGAQAPYNPRRAVHLLAVPVLDPADADAGADAAPSPEPTTAEEPGDGDRGRRP